MLLIKIDELLFQVTNSYHSIDSIYKLERPSIMLMVVVVAQAHRWWWWRWLCSISHQSATKLGSQPANQVDRDRQSFPSVCLSVCLSGCPETPAQVDANEAAIN